MAVPDPDRPGWRKRAVQVLRGLAAVAALLITAADSLVTAFLGVPRVAWLARRIRTECGDEYRRARAGAIDAEVIEDPAPSTGDGL